MSSTFPPQPFPTAASPGSTRLFLTGGSGYVGRNLIRHFTSLGVDVVALARSVQACTAVESLGARAVQGDLFSPNLQDDMVGCQALIHAAADTDHGLPSAAQHRTNVEGTRHVLAAARQAGIRRAVHLSTESVLLDGTALVQAHEQLAYPPRPAGGYSASKAEAERTARAMNGGGLDVVIVRPRFVWGRDDTTALPQLLAAVDSGKFAWIDGGHYRTSTTHIANLVHGIERALLAGTPGGCYFIADADDVEFRTFIGAMLATQGRPVPDKEVPRWLVRCVAAAGAGMARLLGGRWQPPVTRQALATSAVEVTLDTGKARRELGYVPPITREQGLAELQASYAA